MKQHSLFVFVLCLLSWFWQPITAQAATTVCNPDNATVCIDPQFVQAWQRGGGLRDYGYPMAAATPMRQGTQTFDAQLFERARIEIHRDAGANTRVMLGRIGADVITAPPAVIKGLASHVLTDKGLDQFMKDWAKTGQKII